MFRLFSLSCIALLCMLVVTLYRQVPQTWASLPQWESSSDFSNDSSSKADPFPGFATVQITVPPAIAAGERVTVTVVAHGDVEPFLPIDPAPVQLFVFNTNGVTLLEEPLHKGTAHFVLTEIVTSVAGEVRLQAVFADPQAMHAMAVTTLTIQPGAPVEPVLALVGPRSITADGEHWTMLTALPNDKFGNAVAENTPVIVRIAHPATALADSVSPDTAPPATAPPGTDLETITVETSHLFAWARIHSRTKAGRIYLAANAGTAHSPERTVMAVPGLPVSFALQTDPVQLIADGRRLVAVATEPLTDQYQNLLLNGTAVTFLVSDQAGRERRLPAQVVDGKATVQIQAPTHPGQLEVAAVVLNRTSPPLILDFAAGIGVNAIAVQLIDTEEIYTVVAGPLLGPLGQYIPDGSVVDFAFHRAEDDTIVHRTTAPAEAGFATAVVRNRTLPPGRYQVLVAAGVGTGEITINHR